MNEHEHKTKKVELDIEKAWAIFAYIFFPLPLIFAKERSSFLNYHINQGIILFIVSIVGGFCFGIFPFFINFIFKIFTLVLFIMGIINVSKKKMEPLPVIGDLFNFIK